MKKRKPQLKKKTKRASKKKPSILKEILRFLFLCCIWLCFFVFILILYYCIDLPDISKISTHNYKPQITIRDSNSVVLAKYGDIRGDALTYGQMPVLLVNAVIATEDRRFFDHFGVDIFGIIRANFKNIVAGKLVQGGSTITQQLAKIAFLSPERTLKRKVQEAIIALQLEHRFSKQQIMSIYLNRVYLGKGIYGIDAASKYYFGKYAEDLNIFESAIIAGMLKAPSRYSPSNNHVLSVKRARHVLRGMQEHGYISIEEEMNAKPPKIIKRGGARGALLEGYFSDYVIEEIENLIGRQEIDLDVYTTLDISMQKHLTSSMGDHMREAKEKFNASEAAGVILSRKGAIKAMKGGLLYQKSEFNRATKAKRQTGSAFKIAVYLAALENGISLRSHFEDKPIKIKKWSPKNYTKKHYGKMTLKDAFRRSINTITVQVSEGVGRDKVLEMAKRLGISDNTLSVPSIALGVTHASLLDLTAAYGHVANNGYKVRPYAITKIIDQRNKKTIYSRDNIARNKPILSHYVVRDMKEMLFATVEGGSGINAKLKKKKAYGKTGTTQKHRDAWFIGFVDDGLICGIWVGNDNEAYMRRVTGSNIPAYIWKSTMNKIYH